MRRSPHGCIDSKAGSRGCRQGRAFGDLARRLWGWRREAAALRTFPTSTIDVQALVTADAIPETRTIDLQVDAAPGRSSATPLRSRDLRKPPYRFHRPIVESNRSDVA